MTPTTNPPPSPLNIIPDAERIRDRLSALFTEARLLRRLLRVAVAVQQELATAPAGPERTVRDAS